MADVKDDRAWMEHGACIDKNPDLWFPERGDRGKEAIAICATCPVRVDCLEYAITHHESFGIWGGRNVSQRTRTRRRRAPGEREAQLARIQRQAAAALERKRGQ
jgi:WhiB family redox-sensing transcriptional regulator